MGMVWLSGSLIFRIDPKCDGQAVCFVCDSKIAKSEFRHNDRLRVSTSFRVQRRIHAMCFSRANLPDTAIIRDQWRLRVWLDDASIKAEARLALEGCLARR